jgi:C-terminal processing protease CtpA/Prc
LKYIEDNRNQKENFYVTTEYLGNIKVTNEPIYEDSSYPNEKYRMLGLFKYWNIIEYFFPYKYLTDQSWDSVLIEMIPKIQDASDIDEYQSTLEELVAKIDDSHAYISFNKQPKKYLPVIISHVEGKAVISSYYNDSIANFNNLKLGDVILKINDLDISKEREKHFSYVSGSNLNHKTKKTYDRIFIGPENQIKLTIERNGELLEINSKRYEFKEFYYWYNSEQIKSKSINEKIGYIDMSHRFLIKEFDEIFKSFEGKEYIIVDLRTYPDGKYKMFTRYFNSEKRVFAKTYSPDISYPGRYLYKNDVETSKSRKAFKGKFILLVNEQTISLSEFTAMAFQTADHIITVGNQTAGADGRNIEIKYLGGYKTSMTGTGVLYPDGTETQRKGVKIDVEVKPTIKGLRQGRDEVLEKAIKIAKE